MHKAVTLANIIEEEAEEYQVSPSRSDTGRRAPN